MIVFFFFNVHAVNKPFTKFVSPGCFVENPFFGFRAFLLHAYFMNSARNSTQILLMYLLKFTKAKRKQCVPMTCSPFIGQHDIISGTLAVKFSLLRKKKKKNAVGWHMTLTHWKDQNHLPQAINEQCGIIIHSECEAASSISRYLCLHVFAPPVFFPTLLFFFFPSLSSSLKP